MNRQTERSSTTALILFVRLPRAGVVKTRLAANLGDELANKFYRLCAERILRESRHVSGNIRRYVFCADKNNKDKVQRWVGREFHIRGQRNGDLGTRMYDAFASVFSSGAETAILVGTDIPDLSAHIIETGYRALETHDVVIGPTYDGGYYLLGTNAVHRELFAEMPWSTERVLGKTFDVLVQQGFSYRLLPRLIDVDTETDLKRWCAHNGHQRLQDCLQRLEA